MQTRYCENGFSYPTGTDLLAFKRGIKNVCHQSALNHLMPSASTRVIIKVCLCNERNMCCREENYSDFLYNPFLVI